ncbi:MAG: tripartite tricarboxylate transporter TctB family protein [Candidatus Rokubacteria bacterium]|nr:tripartite tricarboxylate transporter TctB family protein [Candidatus Rokubacteria bacterium]MBI2157505.1 tripartite tricarboxylate transporter TctB family protein [Candidatus Rokubacteria bacterium]
MRRANLVCGSLLLALGALSLVEALRLKDDWQGARLMPAVLAVVFAGLGAGHFAPALAAAERPAWPDVPSRRRVGFVFGVLVLYVAVLPSLGFLPATALFVLVLLRALAAFSWTVALALTAAIALASHVVFKHWLGMPLPSGPLGL